MLLPHAIFIADEWIILSRGLRDRALSREAPLQLCAGVGLRTCVGRKIGLATAQHQDRREAEEQDKDGFHGRCIVGGNSGVE